MIHSCKAALGQLQRSAGFSITVILILAIGIGVTTAMYSVLYAVVLQPLPFPQPDRLVALSAKPWDNFSIPTVAPAGLNPPSPCGESRMAWC
jgi:hypothetical protein